MDYIVLTFSMQDCCNQYADQNCDEFQNKFNDLIQSRDLLETSQNSRDKKSSSTVSSLTIPERPEQEDSD